MSIYHLKKCVWRAKIIANKIWRSYMIYERLNLDVMGRSLVLDTYLEEGASDKDSVLIFPGGGYAAHMSGSGPSVFGLFRTREEANRAAVALGKGAYAVSSVL